MYSDVSCTSLVVPYFLPLFPWHLGTGSLSFMCLIRFFKCFSPISCIHVKMPLCTPLCHLDNYTCIVHISLPLSFTCVDPGPFTLKVSIYPSFCQYAANVTMVKILVNAKSVYQNLNTFNVVISVLHQGGHSGLTKCLFVEFGTANAKRETYSLTSWWEFLLSL